MDLSMLQTNWIWLSEWTLEDAAEPHIVCFRKQFELQNLPQTHTIRISADSRYKLYINGNFVQEGPQKALSMKEWFVDRLDIAAYLREGTNTAAVEVLRYPTPGLSMSHPTGNDSLLHTELPGLFVEDAVPAPGFSLNGKSGWKCRMNRGVRIVGEETNPAPIHAQEHVVASADFAGWKLPGYDDTAWPDVKPYLIFDLSSADAPANLVPRTIPPMAHTDRRFESVSMVREGEKDEEAAWNTLIHTDVPLIIPAHCRRIVELSAGEEMCGYLLYSFSSGTGASIETLCSECYAYPQPPVPNGYGGVSAPPPRKGDRTDAISGELLGHTSIYTVSGNGTQAAPETYEPFWFRTFRYIRLTIETKDEQLIFLSFSYRSTAYPLEIKTRFTCSDETFAPIWDISVRTLRCCMHETYMDCPFYEQLQYAMDGRSEILYTYAVSADDRLARQAMEAFRLSQRPDGLVNADAPTQRSNVIPGFSIYYLLMVHDHMMYFGDKALVRLHLPAIDRILSFFDGHLTENGLVGKIGAPIMRDKYWSFIDWSQKWDSGVPTAYAQGCGAITAESLLYLYGLQKAAELASYIGWTDVSAEYAGRADALKAAIRNVCMGRYQGQPLIQDGPGVEAYSVHAQVLAILTGVVSPEEGKAMLQKTVGDPDIPQASVSFMFYLFRALEICVWYEKTDDLWNLWRQMIKDNLTTCVENDTDARSDCHAWAALMCYEMPTVMLGVRPAAPGFAKVHIAPQADKLQSAEGNVITPRGMVHVAWKKDSQGKITLHAQLPDGMESV